MSIYRDCNCNALNSSYLNKKIKISGWIDKIRDHGNLIFIDLRDNFGITQCVIDSSNNLFSEINKLKNESVITISGLVIKRSPETKNLKIPSGEIEIKIESFNILSICK